MNENSQREEFDIKITSAADNTAGNLILIRLPDNKAALASGAEAGFTMGIEVSKNVPGGLYGYNVMINDGNYAEGSFFVNVE